MIVKVLVTRTKFLEPSGYCGVINSIFTSRTINVSSYIGSVMVQFELTAKVPELNNIAC